MAIRAPLEPALVLAGAGTGKTSVMAERAIWLIENENIGNESNNVVRSYLESKNFKVVNSGRNVIAFKNLYV